MKCVACVRGRRVPLGVEVEGESFYVQDGKGGHRVTPVFSGASTGFVRWGGRIYEFGWWEQNGNVTVLLNGTTYSVRVESPLVSAIEQGRQKKQVQHRLLEVRAPIPGLVSRVWVRSKEKVSRGKALLTLEAMKMQNEIPSPRDAVVREVRIRPGASVEKDQLLILLE